MRASPPMPDIRLPAAQLDILPQLDRLRSLDETLATANEETIEAILREAARFADDVLVPLNARDERDGPAIVEGRVHTSPAHREAWASFTAAGWPSLDLPVEFGGQGLPVTLAVAVQEIFDRACPAFGMLTVPIRSAVRLIASYGDDRTKDEWLPQLTAGAWGATICISESGAGSDVARIRTRAAPDADGVWRIDGEKQWISYGDHDLTARIGHCLLARTPEGGLSLFLVPNMVDGRSNGVVVRRLEEKLGLHLSPTCALGFENARGVLLGEVGRGLPQMFVMITNMRLAVGAMGLGIASGAADMALNYAEERIQGGGRTPCPIIEHPDVQRQLLEMHAQVEMLRGLLLSAAAQADLAAYEADMAARQEAELLSQWLLPIIKTLGGEVSFDVASSAIQVLGGAGYTRDWPVEQALRDARVLTVFEGTTGIQALDLLHRRLLKDGGRGLQIFSALALKDAATLGADLGQELRHAIDALNKVAIHLQRQAERRDADAGATAFLHLAGLAALGWAAARLSSAEKGGPATDRLRALAKFWLTGLRPRIDLAAGQATAGAERLSAIAAIRSAEATRG